MYLVASICASVNILFMVMGVITLSLFLPDTLAGLLMIIVGIVSLASDSMYAVQHSALGQQMIQGGDATVSLWRVVWPKIAAFENVCTSLIQQPASLYPGPIHPALNIALYCAVLGVIIYYKFSREEIS